MKPRDEQSQSRRHLRLHTILSQFKSHQCYTESVFPKAKLKWKKKFSTITILFFWVLQWGYKTCFTCNRLRQLLLLVKKRTRKNREQQGTSTNLGWTYLTAVLLKLLAGATTVQPCSVSLNKLRSALITMKLYISVTRSQTCHGNADSTLLPLQCQKKTNHDANKKRVFAALASVDVLFLRNSEHMWGGGRTNLWRHTSAKHDYKCYVNVKTLAPNAFEMHLWNSFTLLSHNLSSLSFKATEENVQINAPAHHH